jgi:DNA-binding transcriptional regulator LsrR (DeoR family)
VSFRVNFITQQLKHADSHVVSKIVGHKNISTTLNVMNKEKMRKILDKGYSGKKVSSFFDKNGKGVSMAIPSERGFRWPPPRSLY